MGNVIIDWGDGTTDTVPASPGDAAWTVADKTHAYTAPGPYTVQVTGPGGSTDSAQVTVVEPPVVTPTVTGVSPSPLSVGSSTVVTITGTGFTGASAVIQVLGSNNIPIPFTVDSATQITATASNPEGFSSTGFRVQSAEGESGNTFTVPVT